MDTDKPIRAFACLIRVNLCPSVAQIPFTGKWWTGRAVFSVLHELARRAVPGFLVLVPFMWQLRTACAAEPGGRERTFVRALEVFDAARAPQEYRESAVLLESLLANGYRNGAVYYNLGNAWFRAGEYGRAIAAYRK